MDFQINIIKYLIGICHFKLSILLFAIVNIVLDNSKC